MQQTIKRQQKKITYSRANYSCSLFVERATLQLSSQRRRGQNSKQKQTDSHCKLQWKKSQSQWM